MTTEYKGFTVPTAADAPSGPQMAQDLVDDVVEYRTKGLLYKRVRNTAAGGGVSASPINMAPPVSIPANPFGAGIPYRVRIVGKGRCTTPGGSGFGLQARLDGVVLEETDTGHTGTSSANLAVPVGGSTLVSNPEVAHTAAVTITGSTNVTVLNDKVMNLVVDCEPATALP